MLTTRTILIPYGRVPILRARFGDPGGEGERKLRTRGQSHRRAVVLIVVVASSLLALAPLARAEAPEFLTRVPADGQPGGGAGELNNPRGVAANPATGHVYVADLDNARVNEYTPWGLFVKSWGWGVADGSAKLQTCGPPEPEEIPDPALCRQGIPGEGKGQFAPLGGIEVDGEGDVWVADLERLRVQKFSPAGDFKLMVGGDVNKTKVDAGAPVVQRNLCPVDPGDICQSGSAGSAPAHLSSTVRNVIAYSPSGGGAILVGDKGRIQIFNLDGTYREEIGFSGALATFADRSVTALDVDDAGDIYFSVTDEEGIFKLDPSGVPLTPGVPGASKFGVRVPLGVAVDHNGNVYAIDDAPVPGEILPEVGILKFDPAGNKLMPTKSEEEDKGFFPYVPFQGPQVNGIATNICSGSSEPGNLYVTFFRFGKVSDLSAYGSPPIGCEPPPSRAPVVAAQYATSVGTENAMVQAQINPKFWPGATYYVEYGEGSCSAGDCTLRAPVAPAVLTELSVNKALPTAVVSLSGLQPNRTYHYRFVAESDGGGPVFGSDPDGEGPNTATFQAGLEGTFKTFNPVSSTDSCSSDPFRVGAAARLPDCRAYELVSPLDKGGGDVALWRGRNALPPFFFELHQSAPSAERFTFTSAYAFDDPEAAPYVSQYLAERRSVGWASESISPPRTALPIDAVLAFGNEFQGFSPDLCKAWLRNDSTAPLKEGAVPGYPNLYRRENCAVAPTFEPLATKKPPNRSAEEYVWLRALGASADGTHAIFIANDSLLPPSTPTLPDPEELLLYERTPAGLRFVCYLPSGKPSPQACGAGTPGGIQSSVRNAISADGSRIFWTAYTGRTGGGDNSGVPGQIFVRVDGAETRKVSTSVAFDPARYWTAADDGSKVVFRFESGPRKDELYEFDVDAQKATLIAKGVEGPMGASEDVSRIYFASSEDLDSDGPGSKGAHNLYFYDANGDGGAGTFTFVMALAAGDIGGSSAAPRPIEDAPHQRSARITTNGLHATFTSIALPPSGYDNLEAASGEPAQEVYRYDAGTGELRCVSCNPTGARPTGEEIGTSETYFATARIQGWEVLQHAPRVISEDGSRVFFESLEALVPRDTNGTWDVYQWEEPGKGTCDKSDSTYGTEAGGCVDLISSGESPAKSTFLDADPSGDNVFFSTQSSLVGQDYGLNDVYVARVGGGFPEPQPKPTCEGDACQGPSAAPVPPTPSSSTYRGPEAVKPKRCPKGKRKVKRAGKVRCVPKKRKGAKAGKRAAARRGSAR
jgi:NHL repeat